MIKSEITFQTCRFWWGVNTVSKTRFRERSAEYLREILLNSRDHLQVDLEVFVNMRADDLLRNHMGIELKSTPRKNATEKSEQHRCVGAEF